METPRDIYNNYQEEAEGLIQRKSWKSLFLTLAQLSGIFLTITLVVFFVVNYQFIKSQIVDWKKGEEDYAKYVNDSDKDGMPDWWETKYGLDPLSLLDKRKDPDHDSLVNYLEYQYGTDPTVADSDSDGFGDGEEVRTGFDPMGEGRTDLDKDGIPDWWEQDNGLNKKNSFDALLDFDKDGLSNKDEFLYGFSPHNSDTGSLGMTDGEKVASGNYDITSGEIISQNDRDQDRLDFFYENLFGTDPNNPDTDGDGYDDYREIINGYDPTGPDKIKGEIEIPTLQIKAPIVWSQSEDNLQIQKELLQGVVHYPGTAFPLFRGNSYVTGHSSFYPWVINDFTEILKNLNELKVGHEVIFHFSLANGKVIDSVYSVVSSEVVMPDDEKLFRDFEGYELTLVTCWPVGTDQKRLMVKAELKSPLLTN